jgi:hypothetical protein
MMTTVETVSIGTLAATFSSLITFLIKTIGENKRMAEVKEEIRKSIQEHEDTCPAVVELQSIRREMETVRTALVFLVKNGGGDPRELGLV